MFDKKSLSDEIFSGLGLEYAADGKIVDEEIERVAKADLFTRGKLTGLSKRIIALTEVYDQCGDGEKFRGEAEEFRDKVNEIIEGFMVFDKQI